MATKLSPVVDLKTASTRQLESLPNIGPKSAQEIIQFCQEREKLGKQTRIVDFRAVNEGLYKKLKNLALSGKLTDGYEVDFSDSEEEGAGRHPEKEAPGTEYAQLSLLFQQMMAQNTAQFKQMSGTVEKIAASQEETRQEMLRLGDRVAVIENSPPRAHGVSFLSPGKSQKVLPPSTTQPDVRPRQPVADPEAKFRLPPPLKREPQQPAVKKESIDPDQASHLQLVDRVGQVIKDKAPPLPSHLMVENKARKTTSGVAPAFAGGTDGHSHFTPAPTGGNRDGQLVFDHRGNTFRARSYCPKMKYDGKTDFNAFLVKFELCGEAYFWSEQDKMLHLVEILEDEALRFFSRQSEEIRRSYELSKQQLIRMFGKHETQPTLRAELAAIRQKEEEDLEKYGQRVMHLSYRAFADFPPAVIEIQGLESFLRGCTDSHTAEVALNRQPNTLSEAIEYTRVAQSNHTLVGSHAARAKVRSVPVEKAETPVMFDKILALLQRMEAKMDSGGKSSPEQKSFTRSGTPPRSPSRASPEDSECFYCHNIGHFARNCPKKQASPQRKGDPPKKSEALN